MLTRSLAAGATLMCAALTAGAQQANPLDNVPDKMPFDILSGSERPSGGEVRMAVVYRIRVETLTGRLARQQERPAGRPWWLDVLFEKSK